MRNAIRITADVGSPDDLDLFDAATMGTTYERQGSRFLVELESVCFPPDVNPPATRVYRLLDPAVFDWDHGSNESFA